MQMAPKGKQLLLLQAPPLCQPLRMILLLKWPLPLVSENDFCHYWEFEEALLLNEVQNFFWSWTVDAWLI